MAWVPTSSKRSQTGSTQWEPKTENGSAIKDTYEFGRFRRQPAAVDPTPKTSITIDLRDIAYSKRPRRARRLTRIS